MAPPAGQHLPVDSQPAKSETFYQRIVRELGQGRYVDVSKETQFSEAWLMLGALLTFAGLVLNNAFLLSAALILFVIAGATWLWNNLGLFGLHYERRLSEVRAFLGETITLTLEVRNRKFLPLTWLEIVDTLPSALPLDGTPVVANPLSNLGEFRTFWTVGAFQRLTRHFQVHCTHRGYHTYGPATVTTGDGFGLFSRKALFPAQTRLIIYPRLYSTTELGLPAKNPFGTRVSRNLLFEDPLRPAGIREWRPADSVRRIHWKATARQQSLSQNLRPMLSRVYEPSEEPQIIVFLNVATLPKPWQGNIPELLERAISVAGSLAAYCAEIRLPIGLVANGFLPGSDQSLRLLPGRSPEQLTRIMELLAAVTPFATQPIERLLMREAPRLPWGATILVVTAVAHSELLAALLELQGAGRQVVLFTLAEQPPTHALPGILVYHLPHLVEDLIAPEVVQGTEPRRQTFYEPDRRGVKGERQDAAR